MEVIYKGFTVKDDEPTPNEKSLSDVIKEWNKQLYQHIQENLPQCLEMALNKQIELKVHSLSINMNFKCSIAMEKTKIFVTTYKDFTLPVTSEQYQVIDSRSIETELPFDDKFYSELYHYKWVYDNLYEELPMYVGFCHYRKYFSFMDKIPNMTNDKVIILKPLYFNCSIREQYGIYHNIEDLEIVEEIIKEKFNDYAQTMEQYLNGNEFIWCNMFIMSKEWFKRYIKFIFGVLDEYISRVGVDIRKRITDNKNKYLKSFYPNNTFEYQYRIGGYLAERLTGVFIHQHFKLIEQHNLIISEKKY